jgi:tripartite-type tricarboxylate transporter receptor subunit TctC
MNIRHPMRAWASASARVCARSCCGGLLAAGLIFLPLSEHALAQNYPTKSVRLIVPFAPGGNVDVTARGIAPGLSEVLGQSVIVENRAGAGGVIGADLVAKAAPDGYTLLLGTNSTFSIAPAVYPKVPYNPVTDFAPISLVASTPIVLVVRSSSPAKTIKDLIALAKANPGRLMMASGGTGSSNHLVGELFQSLTDVKFTHIPYKGAAPAAVDLLGGRVDLLFDQLSTAAPRIKSGEFRALVVTSKTRAALLPDVPTMAESTLPDFELLNVAGLLAPAGTPAEIIDKLNAAIHKVLNQPAVKERFAAVGVDTGGSTPGEFGAFIKQDFAQWTKVVKDANIKVE